MIKKLLRNIFVGILAFILGIFFIEGVSFTPELNTTEQIKAVFLIGALLGLANTIILPILSFILLPIRIVTLGIANVAISISMVIIVSHFFTEIVIVGLFDFFLLTLIVWILSFVFSISDRNKS